MDAQKDGCCEPNIAFSSAGRADSLARYDSLDDTDALGSHNRKKVLIAVMEGTSPMT